MFYCFADNVEASLDISLPASPSLTRAAEASSTAAASAVASHAQALRGHDVALQLGNLRLLRDLAYKGQSFVPFTPTKQALVLFPCAIDPATRTGLGPEVATKMATFISHLRGGASSPGIAFDVVAGVLCKTSGSAALVLACGTVTDALSLLATGSEVACQDVDVRTSTQFNQVLPCCFLADGSAAAVNLRERYYVPACSLCAERLEPTLSGLRGGSSVSRSSISSNDSNSATCSCASGGPSAGHSGASPRSCTCLQRSSCRTCQQLLSVQTVGAPAQQQQQQVRCQECRQSGDPWICMICGYVGCSRYQAMHAKDHFVRSAHFFSINLLTQQIWDYHSDAFVHHAMFLVDATSGKTTRLHYPGRDDETGLLGADEDAEGTLQDDCGAVALSTAKYVDPVAEKKVVTGKYDAKLSTSHTQYATVLKNELDIVRATLTENAWWAVRSADPKSRLTREEVGQLLERQIAKLSEPADDTTDGEGGPATRRGGVGRGIEGGEEGREEEEVDGVYDTLFASLEPLVAVLEGGRQEEQSIAFGLQHLSHEMALREEEGRSLEMTESLLIEDFRVAVRRNLMQDMDVNNAIAELRMTIREIELNVATQQRLASRMGSGDAASRVVIMGTGKGANSKGSSSKGKPGKK